MDGTDRSTGEMLSLLERMRLIRRFEERAAELRAAGHVPGFLHPYIGQEAVAVGVCAALEGGDVITSTHRGHGHLIARGAQLERLFAELFARRDGYNRGKGGSAHITDAGRGFLGANGIVGGGIPIATGAALQIKRQAIPAVAVSFFGDGATNQGAFHESLNLAALWQLPVIFVCENNLYGEFTRQDKHQTIKDIATRADSYNMAGVIVDGNDVLEVRDVVAAARARAVEGSGPTLVEAKTYRHRGHYEGDMARYRPADEVAAWMARDPIAVLERKLEGDGVGRARLDELQDAIERQLEAAIEIGLSSPHPQPEEALEHVYASPIEEAACR